MHVHVWSLEQKCKMCYASKLKQLICVYPGFVRHVGITSNFCVHWASTSYLFSLFCRKGAPCSAIVTNLDTWEDHVEQISTICWYDEMDADIGLDKYLLFKERCVWWPITLRGLWNVILEYQLLLEKLYMFWRSQGPNLGQCNNTQI